MARARSHEVDAISVPAMSIICLRTSRSRASRLLTLMSLLLALTVPSQ
jgi:hypothetical protein